MRGGRTLRAAVIAATLAAGTAQSYAQACDPAVENVLDQQRKAYIAAASDLADQNYSRRPGSFASTTCLDNLMKGGGLDIFFKPPSLDSLLGMVKNLACQQASQIFNGLLGGGGGGGVNGGSLLKVGEIVSGTNIGGKLVSVPVTSISSSIPSADLGRLFK